MVSKNILNSSKKANLVGFAIIGLAFLLLLGSLSFDTSTYSSNDRYYDRDDCRYYDREDERYYYDCDYFGHDDDRYYDRNRDRIVNFDLTNEIIFEINDTTLGEEVIETTEFPNIKIGSAKEYEELYYRKDVTIRTSAFSNSQISVRLDDELTNSSDFLGVLIMAYPTSGIFEEPLGIVINNNLVHVEREVSDLPVFLSRNEFNKTGNSLLLTTEEVEWFGIGGGNSIDFNEVVILAVKQDKAFSSRSIDFLIDKKEEHLEDVRIKLSVICPAGEDGSTPIEAYVNGFKVLSQNPKCVTSNNLGTILSAQVPLSVLKDSDKDEKNVLFLETSGQYETSLQIEEVSFNDKYTYTFNLNNNDDLYDVIFFGDFDKETLDIQLNSHRFEVPRRETVSIRNKLRSGKNVLTIRERPVEIREFIIEQVNRD